MNKGQLTYAILALFISLTIIINNFLNYKLEVSIENSVSLHKKLYSVSESILALSRLAAQLNAPGNDVFENGRIEKMGKVLNETESLYDHQFKKTLESLRVFNASMAKNLYETQVFKSALVHHARSIFKFLEAKDSVNAGINMAQMDQNYSSLSETLYEIQFHLSTLLKKHIYEQHLDSLSFKNFGIFLAIVGIFLLILILLYGKFMANQYNAHQQEKDHILQKTKQQKIYFEGIIDSAADAIIIIDSHGIMVDCNVSATKLLGYSKEDLLGHNIKMIMPEEHSKQHDQYLKNYLTTRVRKVIGTNRDVQCLLKDAQVIDVEIAINAVKFKEHRSEEYFVGIIRDIRERKNQQRLIIEAQKAAELANRSKSEFLANMSHEIRTPMNGILGSANLLCDTALNEEQNELSQMIVHSTRSLLVVINDILDYSKIEAGKMTIEIIAMNFRTVINDVVQLLHGQAQAKGLDLIVNFPENGPINLLGDPHRLRQILLNILSNSVKFTVEGQIALSVDFLPLNEQTFRVKTTVKDTGIGMTPEQVSKLFTSFSQADTSTSRKYGGTGLGTCISKKLVELMGGKMWAESEIGKGSAFIFELDMQISKEAYVNKETVDKPKRDYQKTILLAEDNVINQKVAMRTLEKLGLKILLAKNGKEAVQLAMTEDHELILMDIQMPEMNGIEATLFLLEQGYKKPIIAMTANVMENDIATYLEAGMAAHIPKPLNLHQLILSLDQFL